VRLTDLFVVMIQIQINDVNKTVKLKTKGQGQDRDRTGKFLSSVGPSQNKIVYISEDSRLYILEWNVGYFYRKQAVREVHTICPRPMQVDL